MAGTVPYHAWVCWACRTVARPPRESRSTACRPASASGRTGRGKAPPSPGRWGWCSSEASSARRRTSRFMTRPPVGVHNAAAAAALSKFGVFGLLVDAIVCRSDTRRLLVSPKVARAMRWRRSERDRGHFRPSPIFAVSDKFEVRSARTRLRSRVTPILS